MEKQNFLGRMLFLLTVTLLPLFSVSAQEKTEITGKVTSTEDSEALIGVNILVKGTSSGTITDLDGNYSLKANSDDVLVFSFIGHATKEVPVNGQTSINVQLSQDAELEEVVVIGYGTAKKSHLTGSVSKVNNEGLDQIPVSRMEEALVGQVSGVNIAMTDASAGGDPTIRVRGIGSITAGASPLIVVDGIPLANDPSALGSIDMNNVESVEVLKDAASAAIYGSRGANGVVMITTKGGKSGKTTFSFNSYWGVKFTKDYGVTPDVAEWADYVAANDVNGLTTDQLNYVNLLGAQTTDWEDIMFDGGTIQSYSLAARGGSEKTTFAISTSYLQDEGVLLTDEYQKFNINLNVKSKINKVVEFGLRANPSYSHKRDFPIGIHDALRGAPWMKIYHDETTLPYAQDYGMWEAKEGDYTMERHFYYNDATINTTSNRNPYAKVMEREYTRDQYKLYSNAYLKFNILDGLTFRTSVGANVRYFLDEDWVGAKAHRNGASAMENDITTSLRTRLINENILTYNKTFGKHDLNTVAGVSFEQTTWYDTQNTGSDYEFEYIRTLNAAATKAEMETDRYTASLHSVLGRINYAFDNKYLLSVSVRTDGSSKFGEDTKYGLFPAASVGWRVTQESFMQNIPFISNLKARFSYGVTGNNDIRDYLHMSLLDPVTAVFNGTATTGFNPANIANPNLGWEQSVEMNPGLDIGLLDNRFNITLDYYERTSSDLLLDQPMLGVTGFEEATINIGEVKNSGIEVEVSAAILTGDFSWNVSANYSHNKNELIDYAGADGTISSVDSKRPAEYIAKEGYPISSFYGYVYEKDIPLENLKNPYWPIGAKAQDCYVKDLNGDGVIDTDDRAILGSPYPTDIWSVTNTLNFKGFDFSFMIQGSHGAKIRNMDPEYLENQFNSRMDYITDTDDPNFFEDADMVVRKIFTDKQVQDASYIALRSVNLGYTLPKSILSKVGFSKARVYVAASNLWFMFADDYTSFNPEGLNGGDGSPLRAGYQRGAAPIAKAVTFGVNLDF